MLNNHKPKINTFLRRVHLPPPRRRPTHRRSLRTLRHNRRARQRFLRHRHESPQPRKRELVRSEDDRDEPREGGSTDGGHRHDGREREQVTPGPGDDVAEGGEDSGEA